MKQPESMNRLSTLARRLALGGALALLPAVAGVLAAAEKGDARRGRLVYEDNCVPCHGTNGDGQGPLGARLGARDFTQGKFKRGGSDEELFQTVSNGISPKMPAWKKKLSPQERRDAVAFVRTFAKKAKPRP